MMKKGKNEAKQKNIFVILFKFYICIPFPYLSMITSNTRVSTVLYGKSVTKVFTREMPEHKRTNSL
jgi:hypothetical protein